LLHGVIDSPDIPLNVSRSYLQSDQNVKKISQYITKKVADRLSSIFKNDRKEFEEKWDDISIFIDYGMLSEEQFYDKARQFFLLKDTDGKFFTLDEYKTLIESSQTDKDGQLIYLYAQDAQSQYTYIEAAKQKGYSVLMMNGQLDTPLINMLEQKLEKTHFTRVDADTVDNLIKRDDTEKEQLDKEQAEKLQNQFKELLPKMDKVIGMLDYVDVIAGGHAGSLREDGSIEAELQVITGATNEMGFNCLSAR
jgi:molecular chaperone HtpG